MHFTRQAQQIAKFMHEVEKQELHRMRYHYSAKSLDRCIFIDGQRFMVRRLSWMNQDLSCTHEYKVYLPTVLFGEYSATTYFEGWGSWDGRYGDITSYCPLERFAHLAAWSHERSVIVRAYFAMQEQVAAEISRMAFPED